MTVDEVTRGLEAGRAVATAACVVPARRAARVDPVEAFNEG